MPRGDWRCWKPFDVSGVLGLGRMGAAIRRNILKPGLLRAAHESHRVAAPVVAHGLGAKDVSVAYEITRMLAGHP